MSLGLQASDGIFGGWSGGFVDTTYDQPRTADTVTRDIVAERQDVTSGSTGDQWTDWFQKAGDALLSYGIKRDAAVTGAELRNPQPMVYSQPAYQQRASQPQGGTLLLIGLAVVIGLAVAK